MGPQQFGYNRKTHIMHFIVYSRLRRARVDMPAPVSRAFTGG